jgi:hypothetical protein
MVGERSIDSEDLESILVSSERRLESRIPILTESSDLNPSGSLSIHGLEAIASEHRL